MRLILNPKPLCQVLLLPDVQLRCDPVLGQVPHPAPDDPVHLHEHPGYVRVDGIDSVVALQNVAAVGFLWCFTSALFSLVVMAV